MKKVSLIILFIVMALVISFLLIKNMEPYYDMEVPCNFINKTNRELKVDLMITDVFEDSNASFDKYEIDLSAGEEKGFTHPEYEMAQKTYSFLVIESENFAYKLRNLSRYTDMVIYDNPLRVEIEEHKN